jgi:hypothetical protein
MREPLTFTIPYVNVLKKEDGWNRNPDDENSYHVIRCHFILRDRQVDSRLRKGDIVTGFTSVPGFGQEKTETVEEEITTLQCDEAIKESLKSEESMLKFVSSLSSSLGSDKVGKLSSEVKSEAQTKLQESFRDSFKVQTSESVRVKKTTSWKYTVNPETFASLRGAVLVSAYNRRAYDLFLIYADYLLIKYKRPHLGSKLRRHKIPEIQGGKHLNIIRFDLPLASIHYWNLLPDLVVAVEGYEVEVADPFAVAVEPLSGRPPYVAANPKPTLYAISNDTFPLKRGMGLF